MMYEFECAKCGERVDIIQIPYEERDNARQHEGCGGALNRQVAGLKQGKPRYQMQGIVTDLNEKTVGHMKGHFGRDAKRERK